MEKEIKKIEERFFDGKSIFEYYSIPKNHVIDQMELIEDVSLDRFKNSFGTPEPFIIINKYGVTVVGNYGVTKNDDGSYVHSRHIIFFSFEDIKDENYYHMNHRYPKGYADMNYSKRVVSKLISDEAGFYRFKDDSAWLARIYL